MTTLLLMVASLGVESVVHPRDWLPIPTNVVVTLIAFAIGAYAAGGRFVVPAAFLVSATWLLTVHALYLEKPGTSAGFFDVAADNVSGLLVHAGAALLGALVGDLFSDEGLVEIAPAA